MGIKYKDPTTGQFKDISVKVADSLPIGTEVDYDGETVPTGWEQVDNPNDYSTTETRIGTWIDGKPLYRKVVTYTATSTIGNTSGTTNISINHNISNLNSIIRTQISDSVDGIYPIANGGSTANVNYYTSSVLNFRLVNIALTARTFYIILEYTKTTD